MKYTAWLRPLTLIPLFVAVFLLPNTTANATDVCVTLTPNDLTSQVAALPENTCIRLPDQTIPLEAAIRPNNGQTIYGQANTMLVPTNAKVDAFILENIHDVTINGVQIHSTLTYGSDLGYGTGFKLMNTERVAITNNTIDGMFAGIDSRLGAKNLTIASNSITIHDGAYAGDSDWNGGNNSFRPTLTSAYVYDTYPATPVESLPGALPIWVQNRAAFCPYANSAPTDCAERVGAVVRPRLIDPSTNPGLLWLRPSVNSSNGSPFFGVKGALINIDAEEAVVIPGGTAQTTPRAQAVIITNNVLRGASATCDTDSNAVPAHYPLPPADKFHAKRGMLLNGIRDLTVNGNTINCLNFSGIAVSNVKDATINSNTLQYLERAIYLFHTNESIKIQYNEILDTTGGAGNSAAAIEIARYAKDVRIENNNLDRVIGFGIRATTPSTNPLERLSSSTIKNNRITTAIEHRAANIPITLNNVSGIMVANNDLQNGLYGVEIRQDCGRLRTAMNRSTFMMNSFDAFEAAAFHEINCAAKPVPFIQRNSFVANRKTNVKIALSRNSNEYLLQRITQPTRIPGVFPLFVSHKI